MCLKLLSLTDLCFKAVPTVCVTVKKFLPMMNKYCPFSYFCQFVRFICLSMEIYFIVSILLISQGPQETFTILIQRWENFSSHSIVLFKLTSYHLFEVQVGNRSVM